MPNSAAARVLVVVTNSTRSNTAVLRMPSQPGERGPDQGALVLLERARRALRVRWRHYCIAGGGTATATGKVEIGGIEVRRRV